MRRAFFQTETKSTEADVTKKFRKGIADNRNTEDPKRTNWQDSSKETASVQAWHSWMGWRRWPTKVRFHQTEQRYSRQSSRAANSSRRRISVMTKTEKAFKGQSDEDIPQNRDVEFEWRRVQRQMAFLAGDAKQIKGNCERSSKINNSESSFKGWQFG